MAGWYRSLGERFPGGGRKDECAPAKKVMKRKRTKYLTVFSLCVQVLEWGAQKADPIWPGGMDYEKINVLIFCVLLPVVLFVSIGMNIYVLVR